MLHIEGTLAMPRKSLNDNFYFASELAKGHEQTIKLRANHDKTDTGIIGESTLTWNEDVEQLSYAATVNHAMAEAEIQKLQDQNIPVKVSLGLSATGETEFCHPEGGDCMKAPTGVKFNEMSVLFGENPGIPEVTLSVVEKKCGERIVELFSEDCKITSISNESTDNISMTDKTEQEIDAELTAKIDAKLGEVLDARLAKVDADKAEAEKAKLEAEKAEADKAEADKAEKDAEAEKKAKSDKDELAKKEELDKSVNDLVEKRVAELTEKLEKELDEKTKLSEHTESTGKVWEEAEVDKQVSLMEKVLSGESVSIKIDKDEFIDKHSVYKPSIFTEAVSTSGTIPGVDVGQQIIVIPGGILVKSIRPWVQVKKIAQGEDTVRFYTMDIPAFGTITEHVSTEITPATHTLTGVDVSANTPRGFRQNVLKTEVEKYPKDLLEKIRETARTRGVEDEVTIVLSTIAAATSQDFGANHLNANDGALITDETDEDAAGVAKAAGVEAAKVRLQVMGHEPDNGAAVLACTPRFQKELIQDTVIVRFIQQASPEISRQGRIAMYFGIEIFVTNSINTANNNAARNICFMKGKAFGLAVGRELELEFDKNINRQSVDIVATHRTNAVVIDATAYVILSSKND